MQASLFLFIAQDNTTLLKNRSEWGGWMNETSCLGAWYSGVQVQPRECLAENGTEDSSCVGSYARALQCSPSVYGGLNFKMLP